MYKLNVQTCDKQFERYSKKGVQDHKTTFFSKYTFFFNQSKQIKITDLPKTEVHRKIR